MDIGSTTSPPPKKKRKKEQAHPQTLVMELDADSIPYVALDICEEFELTAMIRLEAISDAHLDEDQMSIELDEFVLDDRDLVRIFMCTCFK